MYQFHHDRSEIIGRYLLETGCTVRAAAVYFGISKSTVHKDVAVKLRYQNPPLYAEVKALLLKNKSERHLRGGEATRQKYLKKGDAREDARLYESASRV